jgi:4-amino-4-deoxychorismate lyase
MSNPIMGQLESFKLVTTFRYDLNLLNSTENQPFCAHPNQPQPFYLPQLHRIKLLRAALALSWEQVSSLPILKDPLDWETYLLSAAESYLGRSWTDSENAPLKVRVVLGSDGESACHVEFSPVQPVPITQLFPTSLGVPPKANELFPGTGSEQCLDMDSSEWDLFLDTEPTQPTNFTWLKTTQRSAYDAARKRVEEAVSRLGISERVNRKREVLLYKANGELMEGSITSVYMWRRGSWVTPPVGQTTGGQEGATRRYALASNLCSQVVVTVDSLKEGESCWVSNGVQGFQLATIRLING